MEDDMSGIRVEDLVVVVGGGNVSNLDVGDEE